MNRPLPVEQKPPVAAFPRAVQIPVSGQPSKGEGSLPCSLVRSDLWCQGVRQRTCVNQEPIPKEFYSWKCHCRVLPARSPFGSRILRAPRQPLGDGFPSTCASDALYLLSPRFIHQFVQGSNMVQQCESFAARVGSSGSEEPLRAGLSGLPVIMKPAPET
jgi:hypothetical protein